MLDEVTTVGLFLTLVGLLAGFYWFNLAGWVSGLIELKSEAAYYKGSDGKDDERGMIRAKVQGRGSLSNIVTALAVSIFTVVLVLSVRPRIRH